MAGCGRSHPPQIDATSAGPIVTMDPAAHLAGLAAAAQDQKFVAAYTYRVSGRTDRTVVVSIATDGTWSVNVPGGALSGGADVSIVGEKAGVYQCVLGGSATTLAPAVATAPSAPVSPSPSPSPTRPAYTAPACVKIATAADTVPSKYDPVMEHIFTDWLTVLSSRNSPISVFDAKPVSGSAGSCFSVEPSAASLAPVVDAGIFCFRSDGVITAVTLAGASLILIGTPAPGAPTNSLPGPVLPGPAAPTKSP